MKELNIVSLEGYEVDVINSTFEKIVFKKKVYDSWSDFVNIHPSVFDEYYINELGSIDRVDGSAFCKITDVTLCKSYRDAVRFSTFFKLHRMQQDWVANKLVCAPYYMPVYDNDAHKWVVAHTKVLTPLLLIFPTAGLCWNFIDCCKSLLNETI